MVETTVTHCPNPECGAEFRVADEHVGKIGRCKKCGARLRIGSGRSELIELPSGGPKSTPPKPASPEERRKRIDQMKEKKDVAGLRVELFPDAGASNQYVEYTANALADIGGREVVDVMVAAIGDNSVHMHWLEDALKTLKSPRFVDPLIRRSAKETYESLERVGEALVQIGEPAVESLIRHINDKDTSEPGFGISVLCRIGSPSARQVYVALLTHKSEYLRVDAAKALLDIGDTDDLGKKALIELATSGHQYAAEALEEAGWQPTAPNGMAAAYYVARKQWDEVPRIPEAVEPLIDALRSASAQGPYADVCGIAPVLGDIGAPEAVSPLFAAYSRMKDLRAGKWGANAILSALEKIDDSRARDFLREKELKAVKASEVIDSLTSESELIRKLVDPSSDREMQRAIGEKLWQIGGKAAMLTAHSAVAQRKGSAAARHLESTWDGIGTWLG